MKKFSLILFAVFMLQFSIVSAVSAKSTLKVGETLEKGQVLTSDNGIYSLIMQNDGNLVLYKNFNNSTTSLWASGTAKFHADYIDPATGYYKSYYPEYLGFAKTLNFPVALGLQERGKGYTIWRFAPEDWAPRHYGKSNVPADLTGDILVVQDDGNAVVYNTKHADKGWYPVWATNTYGK
ncbi:hypothetical protein [Brevibacillus brevis]|uniref:Bulb-type lectin domain-containing protein n=1 Tax=Brevibacillus brevis TaxID=1393 RepID=A0A517I4H4_BREBE|nr:hypothetical protein [Brevibacillus brevis]QDS33754.1 hypothetical protein FPS98_06940 [Brevibacillus brevis]